MLNSKNTDRAVKYPKTYVNCNRCALCDKSDRPRKNYVCGHFVCFECVAEVGDCPTCLTSPMQSSSDQFKIDGPLPDTVNKTSEPFDLEVYKRQKMSEQLKLEKEVFPACIQAPATYSNKKKSLKTSLDYKTTNSTTVFPGEEISSLTELTMNKSKNYVLDWLDKHENVSHNVRSRIPFSDLEVNQISHKHSAVTSQLKRELKNRLQTDDKENFQKEKINRKRTRLKTLIPKDTQACFENYLREDSKRKSKPSWTSAKKMKKEFDQCDKQINNLKIYDESGIEIDDDCYTIEDTQDQIIDKDKLALEAVAKADLNDTSNIITLVSTEHIESNHRKEAVSLDNNQFKKVPYFKRSNLFENCTTCCECDLKSNQVSDDQNSFKDISISIENDSFITTIQVVDCSKSKGISKKSTAVQTVTYNSEKSTASSLSNIHSQDMFACKYSKNIFNDADKKTQIIIGEKCLMENITASIKMENDKLPMEHQNEQWGRGRSQYVANPVCPELRTSTRSRSSLCSSPPRQSSAASGFGVLTELDGAGIQQSKAVRCLTPDSNNSSDKENCDPNKKKKTSNSHIKKKKNKTSKTK